MNRYFFRAKSIVDNKWVYGYLVQTTTKKAFLVSDINETKIKLMWNKKIEFNKLKSNYFWEVIPETICQYTGTTDKNHQPIYEKDIVKEKNSIGTIVFDSGEYKINWIINKDFFNNCLPLHNKYLEIISDIYCTDFINSDKI